MEMKQWCLHPMVAKNIHALDHFCSKPGEFFTNLLKEEVLKPLTGNCIHVAGYCYLLYTSCMVCIQQITAHVPMVCSWLKNCPTAAACTKNTIPRGSSPIDSCPAGQEKQGALCYPLCPTDWQYG